jgi:glucosamine kinase
MILIADSGSTKAEWVVVRDGVAEGPILTSGISPVYLSENEIINLLQRELPGLADAEFDSVYFYGTGCNTSDSANIVVAAINKFIKASEVSVESDVLGAARSLCFDKPGIACILGTGSNSCYYDGKSIVSNISPLGYILGDEGSAAVIGRRLVTDALKQQLPKEVTEKFFATYNITSAEVVENVYKRPFPSRYLGKFAHFISSNIEIPELQEIVKSSFDDFIVRNVLLYPESKSCPVHFTGSIAYNFKPYLEAILKKHGLTIGAITLAPMENLVKYHLNKI